MPGKNSKQTSAKTETPVAPKVEEPTVEATPAPAPTQKGGKKAAVATSEPKKVEEPKVEATSTPAQKGGKKAAVAASEAKKVEATSAPAQKGGKKVASAATTPAATTPAATSAAATPAAATPAATAPAQKGGKKAATAPAQKGGKKAEKPAKVVKKAEEEAEGEESGDRRIRSFKVKLPDKEEFEGRFTGLTPYQAANKALSKYFRETEKPKSEITFSICESTRKSKKCVYTYVGRRQKLDTPVTYKIQDGREIVKNFKNSLKKVKKSESTTESA